MKFGKKIITLAITGVSAMIGGYGSGNGYVIMQGVIFVCLGGGMAITNKFRRMAALRFFRKED